MTYAIKHIQATFRKAKERIQFALQHENQYRQDKFEGRTWSYIGYLVKADYRWFELHRSRIERCADPTKSDDRDYSEGRIAREFENRVRWYKGVAEEHDNLHEPGLEFTDGNDVNNIGIKDSFNDGTRPACYPTDKIFQEPPFGIAFAEALSRTCWPETSRKSPEGQKITPASETRRKTAKKDPKHLVPKLQVDNGNDGLPLARTKASGKRPESTPGWRRPLGRDPGGSTRIPSSEASWPGPLARKVVSHAREEVHDAPKENVG